uniref:Protein EMSY-LIKE 3 isoform X1 n=1 Tax=Rhizophora mucronata TaxID=61149 RepID=A0A2P2LK02_RHIMU
MVNTIYLNRIVVSYNSLIEVVIFRPPSPHFPTN